MSEQCSDILRCNPQDLRQAMSIHTRKITDACRDKDCVEDLRFYPTAAAQEVLSASQMIKGGTAEFVTFGERHIARRKMRRGFYNF